MSSESENEVSLTAPAIKEAAELASLDSLPKKTRKLYLRAYVFLTLEKGNEANYHLNKVIEVTRVNLFNIFTQYRAIFNDDEHCPLASVGNQNINQYAIFCTWIRDKITEFLEMLETDLDRGITSVDSILGQCVYFGLSFSRVGCDFRSSLVPIFTKRIATSFKEAVGKATAIFESNLERYTLINKNHTSIPWKTKTEEDNQPSDSLLEFYPLANYLNDILTALNELRLCPPVAVVTDVVDNLQISLLSVARAMLVFYGQEQQAFTSLAKDAFTRFCICFADDLMPFIQKCIHVIFPPSIIASHIGVNVQTLQKKGISYIDKSEVVSPIKHLLPIKIEPLLNMTPTEKEGDSKISKENTESGVISVREDDLTVKAD